MSKTLVVPMFIGPAKIEAVEDEGLHDKHTGLENALLNLSANARCNAQRGMVAAWIAEHLESYGEDVTVGLFEGWKGHTWKQFTDNPSLPRVQTDVINGANFQHNLLSILNERGVIRLDMQKVLCHPVSRCTLQEVRGIRSKVKELFEDVDERNVVAVTHNFSPAPWRAASKFKREFRRMRTDVQVRDIPCAIADFKVPMNDHRKRLLDATSLSLGELSRQLMTEAAATAVHVVSEAHRAIRRPPEGGELEIRFAEEMRKNT